MLEKKWNRQTVKWLLYNNNNNSNSTVRKQNWQTNPKLFGNKADNHSEFKSKLFFNLNLPSLNIIFYVFLSISPCASVFFMLTIFQNLSLLHTLTYFSMFNSLTFSIPPLHTQTLLFFSLLYFFFPLFFDDSICVFMFLPFVFSNTNSDM